MDVLLKKLPNLVIRKESGNKLPEGSLFIVIVFILRTLKDLSSFPGLICIKIGFAFNSKNCINKLTTIMGDKIISKINERVMSPNLLKSR